MMAKRWADAARALDAADPLRPFRARFYRREGEIYLDGNSLGLLSRDAEASVLRVLDEWKTLGIEGWTGADPPWFSFSETLSRSVAPLIGADPGEVIVTGSTTVNLHQLLATLYDPAAPIRKRILADELNFPSDIFALRSHLRLRGLNPDDYLIRVPSRDGRTLNEDDILAAMTGGDIQIVVLPSVVYTSGQLLDMERVTRAARERGILIGWDCSHSVGAVPHALSEWGADFAFWCHYKYLNAGPGSVGGLYLNRRHFGKSPGLAGWFGSRKDRQFAMDHTMIPADGAGAMQIGTPHLLSLAPLEGSLRIHHEAGMERLRAKSLALTAFLRELTEAELAPFGVGVATPPELQRRGGHLALIHPEALGISRALRRAGVVPDFRPPDIVRFAPVPLYTSFADCVEAVHRLKTILETQAFATDEEAAGLVT
ncbi:MAG: kynureninase [Akkermansiaceae bacterium]|nr:kynureninase [Armatimonadota bacterium]